VTDVQIALMMVGLVVALVVIGVDIGIALLSLSFVGVWLIKDNLAIAEKLVSMAAYSGIQEYVFATIPLFVLMGMLIAVSDVGKDTFDVAGWALRKLAGGLGMATVASNTVFAAVTGVSIASASVFAKVAVPEMLRHGYSPAFAVGTVAGSSILGMLIPPSVLLIIYGVIAEESIGKLFIAGLVPGVLMAAAFCLTIYLIAVFFKGWAGPMEGQAVDGTHDMDWTEAAGKLAPIAVLVVLMLGGLYAGLFTPTEAGAVGAFGALLLALAKRRLNGARLWKCLLETGYVSVAILFLLITAAMYSRMITLAGMPDWLGGLLQGHGVHVFLAGYIAILLFLGSILDSTSILLILTPLAVPIARAFGMDLIWFGLITVIVVEIGLLTPPLGLSAFAVKASLADQRIKLSTVFAGCVPFIVAMLAVTGLLIAFPKLVTILL
jgi:C4-dicarboxylate transporter, DctM subunit